MSYKPTNITRGPPDVNNIETMGKKQQITAAYLR